MSPHELVPKYIVNRDGVLRDAQALEALSDLGTNGGDLSEALLLGAQYLSQQLHGRNLLFFARPDESGNMALDFTHATIPLDGHDAHFIGARRVDVGKGIISRSFTLNRDELVRHDLHRDQDYLEFSKSAVAVYALPLRSRGDVLGVFCIDSSDRRNFSDSVVMPMIHNFVELLMISLINTRQARAAALFDSRADLLELETQRLSRRYYSALADAWPLSAVVMQALLERPTPLAELRKVFPRQDILRALFSLSRAGLVEYGRFQCTLTSEGERMAAALRKVVAPVEGRGSQDE